MQTKQRDIYIQSSRSSLSLYQWFIAIIWSSLLFAIENQICDLDRLNPSILRKIIDILKINPYCAFFWTLKDVLDLEHQQIHIRSNASLDQRVDNAPLSSQVVAIWVDENASKQHMSRDIIVYSHSGRSHRVQYYFGCYDPLQYPLLFPYKAICWH
jgi:hypothetical protein